MCKFRSDPFVLKLFTQEQNSPIETEKLCLKVLVDCRQFYVIKMIRYVQWDESFRYSTLLPYVCCRYRIFFFFFYISK